MAERKIYLSTDTVQLLYSNESDRRLIYDMAFEEPGIWQSMLREKGDFDWAKIRDEEPHFFGSVPGQSKYMLIQYQGEIIGVISHTFNNGPVNNMELDIWLRSEKYTGRGLGSAAMKALIGKLAKDYSIRIFIIRPWRKNPRAVKAYEKCGFREQDHFNPADYYGKYLDEYGAGDYDGGETVNMVLTLE